jgi:flagellar basal-body rod protein FlgG
MQNGYYQVTGAMVTQFEQLNVTANNLANVNTSGFKRDGLVIGDFERLYQNERDELEHKNHTEKAAKFFNRSINRVPSIVENSIDFSAGSIKQTNNKLDFALQGGDLFFAVDTPSGVRLTQQSSFVVNSDGVLTTKDGLVILPSDFQTTQNREIRIPKDKGISANDKGELFAGDVKGSEKVGTLFVGRVENLKEVKKEGENLYTLEDMDGKLQKMEDGNFVKQGYVMLSNVNAVKEMTSLIETNRLVEMYQKVMTSHMDELNRDAITKLATTRA